VNELGDSNILINNVSFSPPLHTNSILLIPRKAGLALGAPAVFPDLKISGIVTMNGTYID
jgi:hypothetical protein